MDMANVLAALDGALIACGLVAIAVLLVDVALAIFRWLRGAIAGPNEDNYFN